MRIRELPKVLRLKNLNEVAKKIGLAKGSLQTFSSRNKEEAKQDAKCAEVILKFYGVGALELLELLEARGEKREDAKKEEGGDVETTVVN